MKIRVSTNRFDFPLKQDSEMLIFIFLFLLQVHSMQRISNSTIQHLSSTKSLGRTRVASQRAPGRGLLSGSVVDWRWNSPDVPIYL